MSDAESTQLLESASSVEVIYYQVVFLVTTLLLIGLDWVMVNLSQT